MRCGKCTANQKRSKCCKGNSKKHLGNSTEVKGGDTRALSEYKKARPYSTIKIQFFRSFIYSLYQYSVASLQVHVPSVCEELT